MYTGLFYITNVSLFKKSLVRCSIRKEFGFDSMTGCYLFSVEGAKDVLMSLAYRFDPRAKIIKIGW